MTPLFETGGRHDRQPTDSRPTAIPRTMAWTRQSPQSAEGFIDVR
jgi:hypothetical protein